MDLPNTGEEELIRNGDKKASKEDGDVDQRARGPATADNARSDGDNKFQNAISVWRGNSS